MRVGSVWHRLLFDALLRALLTCILVIEHGFLDEVIVNHVGDYVVSLVNIRGGEQVQILGLRGVLDSRFVLFKEVLTVLIFTQVIATFTALSITVQVMLNIEIVPSRDPMSLPVLTLIASV